MPTRKLVFGGLHNSLAENQTPEGRAYAMSNATVDDKNFKCGKRYAGIGSRSSASVNDVGYGMGYGKFSCNETQSLTMTGGPTGGTVVLTWVNDTAAIAYNASAEDVQNALLALTNLEDGEISCSGGPWPLEPIYATFKGRYARATQSLIVLKTNNLTGGSTPTISIAHYVTGGDHEEFIVVVQPNGSGTCTAYSVTSSDSFATTTWTSIATGLTASDWFFQQFTDKIYACNRTDGILYKQMGGAWSGSSGIPSVQNPVAAPTANPTRTDGANSYDFTGATFSGLSATLASVALTGVGNRALKVTIGATALAGDVCYFDAILPSASDWSYQDYYLLQAFSTTSEIVIDQSSIQFTLINNDGSPVTHTPTFAGIGGRADGGTTSRFQREFHFGSKDRTLRDNILKVHFVFTVPQGAANKFFTVQLFRLDTWPNDQMLTLNVDTGATQKALEYAYSYLKSSTLVESKLSPSAFSAKMPSAPHNDGVHMVVTCTGSTQLTTGDYIKVYRKDRFGLWRYIGSMANVTSGTTTFTDKNMLDELDNFPPAGQITLPGGYLPEYMTRWKQCLVVAADRKVWLSYVGNPLIFAPDPEQFALQSTLDTTDPDIPRTVFMSDTRSEDVYGIVGQDSLYLAGPATAYAMTNGDKPMQISPPRPLPNDRGCMGYRAAFKYGGGVLFAFHDGLWYNAVSAGFTGVVQSGTVIQTEITEEVRTSWTSIFGASPSNAIVYVYQSEIYCFAGARYLKFTRNKQIEAGTLTDSVKHVIATSYGLVWIDTKGRLMIFGNYTTDANAAVNFSYTTGILEVGRERVTGLSVQYTGQPSVTVETWDGLGGYESQPFNMEPADPNGAPTTQINMGNLLQGTRFRITLAGTGTDTIESLYIDFEDASKGGAGN